MHVEMYLCILFVCIVEIGNALMKVILFSQIGFALFSQNPYLKIIVFQHKHNN